MKRIEANELKERIDEILDLYNATYRVGEAAQQIDLEAIKHKILSTPSHKLWIYVIEAEHKIVASLWATALTEQSDVEVDLSQWLDRQKCIYISEVFVDTHFRGKGLAKQLLQHFMKTCTTKAYHDLLIRVWDKNEVALKLYLDKGFVPVAHQMQTKHNAMGAYEMKKIYLHIKL